MKQANPHHVWMANRDRMFKGLEARQAEEEKSRARAIQAQNPGMTWGEALKRAANVSEVPRA